MATPDPPPIAVPVFGDASPYPSEIAVSGLNGPITNVTVTLQGVGHANPDIIDIFLVSPAGDDVMVMSDACGGDDIEDYNWTFSDQAPRAMSDDSADCGESKYRPTNRVQGAQGDFDVENTLPQAPYGASFASFNNENPNGTWRLYVRDDVGLAATSGDIELGWVLAIETRSTDVAIPATGTSGPASPYPATPAVSGETGMISDLDVSIDGNVGERPEDLDLLLVGPQGQKVIVMSDACGPLGANAYGAKEGVKVDWERCGGGQGVRSESRRRLQPDERV